MKKRKTINPRNLTDDQRRKILHLVAAGYPVRMVAADNNLTYTNVRHAVFWEWRRRYPDHFLKFANPPSTDALRANPPTTDALRAKPLPKLTKKQNAKDHP